MPTNNRTTNTTSRTNSPRFQGKGGVRGLQSGFHEEPVSGWEGPQASAERGWSAARDSNTSTRRRPSTQNVGRTGRRSNASGNLASRRRGINAMGRTWENQGQALIGQRGFAQFGEVAVLARCIAACNHTFAYCIQEGGDLADADHLASLIDTIDVLTVTSHLIARGSDYVDDFVPLAAQVAKDMEECCEEYGDDVTISNCADICRETYEALNVHGSAKTA